MLESSKMSYNIFERAQKCCTVFRTFFIIFSMFERFKQTFNTLYHILSNFRTSGRFEFDLLKISIHFTMNSYSWCLRKDPAKNGKMGRKTYRLVRRKPLSIGIFLIIATKNETWKKEHWMLSLTNWMFKS